MKKTRYVLEEKDADSFNQLREAVFQKYGGSCHVCGESDPNVLTFTQLQPNGFKGTLHWLRRHGYPEDRQLICANCKFKQSQGLISEEK